MLEAQADPPHYKTVREWFESQGRTEDRKGSYRKIFDPSTIEYPEPKAFGNTGESIQPMTFAVPEAYVAMLPNGYLCADGRNTYSSVLAPDRKLILDVSAVALSQRRAEDHWLFGETNLPGPTLIRETAGVLTIQPHWSPSYYHWLFEVLPRVQLLRRYEGRIEKYIVNARIFQFQYETLATLGIDEESIIEVDHPFCIRARKLVVPSGVPLCNPPWACAFLRSQFLESKQRRGRKRLYISRQEAPSRHVVNEDEVREVLATFKFEQFVGEGLSVQEQAEVFASARAVVGPHGAGLTNLVFCQPQTKVLEFFPPRFIHPLYWMLANQCQLEYYHLVGKGEGRPTTWSWPLATGNKDPIEIDPDQLFAVLKEAGL